MYIHRWKSAHLANTHEMIVKDKIKRAKVETEEKLSQEHSSAIKKLIKKMRR